MSRRKLPNDRQARVHEFMIASHHFVLTTGEYEDGTLGEIFINCDTAGSTMSGLMDSFATAVSMALQHGTPLKTLAEKYIGSKFEPLGFTGNAEIPFADSVLDYIFRFLVSRYALKEAA